MVLTNHRPRASLMPVRGVVPLRSTCSLRCHKRRCTALADLSFPSRKELLGDGDVGVVPPLVPGLVAADQQDGSTVDVEGKEHAVGFTADLRSSFKFATFDPLRVSQ